MARKVAILFSRDVKDNINIKVDIDSPEAPTAEEIQNDPMLVLVYKCLEPVMPYITKGK